MFNISKAFSSFSTDDLDKTKEFYSKILGLKVTEEKEMGLLHLQLPHGGEVMIYPKENHQPAMFTILNLTVGTIDDAVDELVKRGVVFEHYDEEMIKTDKKGIARGKAAGFGPDIAWFKDPSGNIVAVMEL